MVDRWDWKIYFCLYSLSDYLGRSYKVECVFRSSVVSILPYAEFRPNGHRKDAPYFTDENFSKIEKSPWAGLKRTKKPVCKVGCVFPMVIVSSLPDPESGPSYHREDATHFILMFGVSLEFAENRVLDQAIFSGSGFWRKWKSSNYSINRWFTFWKSSRNKK